MSRDTQKATAVSLSILTSEEDSVRLLFRNDMSDPSRLSVEVRSLKMRQSGMGRLNRPRYSFDLVDTTSYAVPFMNNLDILSHFKRIQSYSLNEPHEDVKFIVGYYLRNVLGGVSIDWSNC